MAPGIEGVGGGMQFSVYMNQEAQKKRKKKKGHEGYRRCTLLSAPFLGSKKNCVHHVVYFTWNSDNASWKDKRKAK